MRIGFHRMRHHLCQSCTMGGSSNGSGMSTKDSAGFGHEGHNGFQFIGEWYKSRTPRLGREGAGATSGFPDHFGWIR